jgi:TPR repeat protein
MFQMGVALQFGKGVKSDLSQSIGWYERARQAGHRSAAIYLGALLLKLKRCQDAERVLSEGALKNDPEFMYWLAKVYINRGDKVKKARDLLESATASGFLYAQGALARLLLSGKFGWRGIFRGI